MERHDHFIKDEVFIPQAGALFYTPATQLDHSFISWCRLYYNVHLIGSPMNTLRAKANDFEKFFAFLSQTIGLEEVDRWTPSVSKSFINHLMAKQYKATTVNRMVATIRHFATWLHQERRLPMGHPFQGVKDLITDDPAWNGITDEEILLLKLACDIRLVTKTRKYDHPKREAAVLYVLLNTGLREFELVSLNLAQYHHQAFHQIKRKGKKITRKVLVPSQARVKLEIYLEERQQIITKLQEQGKLTSDTEQAMFISKKGGSRITTKNIGRIMQRLCATASKRLPPNKTMHVTPHQLRHTFLKRVADKYGVHAAQEFSGNVSMKEIWRYTQPSEAEKITISENLYD